MFVYNIERGDTLISFSFGNKESCSVRLSAIKDCIISDNSSYKYVIGRVLLTEKEYLINSYLQFSVRVMEPTKIVYYK